MSKEKFADLMQVWIDVEFNRIMICHSGFDKNYTSKLQQNHRVTVI